MWTSEFLPEDSSNRGEDGLTIQSRERERCSAVVKVRQDEIVRE
jgi:hypothetical protein